MADPVPPTPPVPPTTPPPKPPQPPKPPAVEDRARDADIIAALTDLSVDVTHIGHYLTREGARAIALRLKESGLIVRWKAGS